MSRVTNSDIVERLKVYKFYILAFTHHLESHHDACLLGELERSLMVAVEGVSSDIPVESIAP